jgi:WD40 repeat protein
MVVGSAHRSAVTVVETYPGNDSLLISGGADGVVRLWDSRKGGEYVRFAGNDHPITALRVLRSGKHLVAGTESGKLLVRAGG